MTASKVYFRDILGIILVISAAMVMLGTIFSLLSVLNYYSHEEAYASAYIHDAIPLFLFFIPCILLGKYINRPQWVHDVEAYLLEKSKG
ncbi:D-fructose-6-phosphate amidotransferase [Photobacterium makurazakiensis]|uniref:D-fructose-6-phosphate amidotransferase n=1 Tax=Photobacterium makurazakiensis TaxID=2910234 RepID=UPI003D0E503A